MKKGNPVNCIGCGRDTYKADGICWRCSQAGAYQISDKKERHLLQIDGDTPNKTIDLDAEDDYGEESDADSVFIEGRDLKYFQERKKP